MPVNKGPDCVGEEMSRFKKGELHSGKGGKVVTDSKQAKAIALSACGDSKYAEMLQSLGYTEETAKEVAAMFAESFVKSSKKSSSSGAM
jgi:Holliday junction resolvasome RuvABC DNA-binding subunit